MKANSFSVLVILVSLLLSCGGEEKGSKSESGSKAGNSAQNLTQCPEDPRPAFKEGHDPHANLEARICGEIRLWGSSMPKSLNMWVDYNSFSAEVTGLMFEPLVGMHPVKDEPLGVLAQSWEISEDGTEFTFKMDPKAKWSDGKAVSAEDVQFFYDVIMDEKNLTPIFRVGLKRFERPEVVDSLTLKIKAKENHWQNFWEAAGLTALPKHVWKDQDFNKIKFEFPVVSGPYKIKEIQKDRFLLMERRLDWWGDQKAFNSGKYNFQNIRYRFITDRVKALEALKKGDLDVYPIYTASIWAKQTQFDAVKKNWVARQVVYNQEPIGFQGLAINMRREKFKDIKVRKALALLINRELMNKQYMFNQYFLLNSFYPDLFQNNINPDNPVFQYNPDSARALLAEAGWKANAQGILEKGGKPFTISFISAAKDLRHLTRYQEDLKKVGIQANIEQMSYATLSNRLDDFQYDMYWTAWGAGRLRDPERMWHSKQAGQKASQNLPGVQDAAIDSLIELQKTEFDMGKRNEILKEIDGRLAAQYPYVLLWQANHKRVLYWQKFGTPPYVFDKFNREDAVITYWWLDTEKEKALENARSSGKALSAQPDTVRYQN
jgi:microcin C transport system substrate-binding protein